jgi:3-(3-hydroxy-phenyl)propionate hydroxylase
VTDEQRAFLEKLGAVTATLSPGAADSVEDADGTYADFWKNNDVEAFIGRPDFHLFWAGRAADLPAALDELETRLAWGKSPVAV